MGLAISPDWMDYCTICWALSRDIFKSFYSSCMILSDNSTWSTSIIALKSYLKYGFSDFKMYLFFVISSTS